MSSFVVGEIVGDGQTVPDIVLAQLEHFLVFECQLVLVVQLGVLLVGILHGTFAKGK